MDELLSKARKIGAILTDRAHTIAVAESSAGGFVSATLLSVPGASAFFLGGCVVYTAASRSALLGIGEAEMTGLRPASEPYALLIARKVRERHGATWGIAETGAAGPSGNRYGDAAGHTCIAVSGPIERVVTIETREVDRVTNMRTFAAALLDLLGGALVEGQ